MIEGRFIHAISIADFDDFTVRQEIASAIKCDVGSKKLLVILNVLNNNVRFKVFENNAEKILTYNLEEAIEVYNSILI